MNNKNVKKIKISKIFGWIFLVAGVGIFITSVLTYLVWKTKEENYTKQYAYSDYGNLYYEINNDRIYIKKIYNTNDEIIELEIPNQKTVIMYCSKNNNNECIYFDMNNTIDYGMLNPFMNIITTLLLIAIGLGFIIDEKNNSNKEKTSLSSLYMSYVFLFIFGTSMLVWQTYNTIKYFSLKNDNNVTTATIYTEIYNIGREKDLYKPVAYYYINNQKYIYVNDSYIEGYLEDNLGKTFDLYYNKNNPNEVSKKENPVDFIIVIIGIGLTILSFPLVFLKDKMEKRLYKILTKKNLKQKLL